MPETAPTLALTLEIAPSPDPRHELLTSLFGAVHKLTEAHDLTAPIARLPASMAGQLLRAAMSAADTIATRATTDPDAADAQLMLAGALVQGALHQALAALQLAAGALGIEISTAPDDTQVAAPPPPPAGGRRITTVLEA